MDAAAVWAWVVPALVVFGVAGLLAAVGVWALRRSRRSPRARAAAEAERTAAGVALVRLDDEVAELDLEVELSGALYDGTAPGGLRRARLTAQHARDDAFERYRSLEPDTHPDEVRRTAAQIRMRIDAASALIASVRAEHEEWMRANVTAAQQVAAAQRRAAQLRAELGDPSPMLARLAQRFARSEWADAERAARAAADDLDEADRLLTDAAAHADDPTRSALPALADAERRLRNARENARAFDDRCRAVTDAAAAAPEQLEAARAALRQASTLRETLEPVEAERLGAELRDVDAALAAVSASVDRTPAAAVDAVARVRDRLDLAVGDARTAQQRLRGARTALPGTLSAATAALARAEARAAHAGADARVRLASAQQELARANGDTDPVAALDAARRAMRHAEDAMALADYDRLTRGSRG